MPTLVTFTPASHGPLVVSVVLLCPCYAGHRSCLSRLLCTLVFTTKQQLLPDGTHLSSLHHRPVMHRPRKFCMLTARRTRHPLIHSISILSFTCTHELPHFCRLQLPSSSTGNRLRTLSLNASSTISFLPPSSHPLLPQPPLYAAPLEPISPES